MRKNKTRGKFTMWAASYSRHGQVFCICVEAGTKKDACEKLARTGVSIVVPEEVRHIVMVKYPGPSEVRNMPCRKFEANSKPLGG